MDAEIFILQLHILTSLKSIHYGVGPDKKKNEYIIIRDMYFAALKYQGSYIQPWT